MLTGTLDQVKQRLSGALVNSCNTQSLERKMKLITDASQKIVVLYFRNIFIRTTFFFWGEDIINFLYMFHLHHKFVQNLTSILNLFIKCNQNYIKYLECKDIKNFWNMSICMKEVLSAHAQMITKIFLYTLVKILLNNTLNN